MYFSVAEQEISLDGLSVRFAVDRADTSKVILTVNEDGKDRLVATFSRNGYPESVVEPEPEPEPVAEAEAPQGYANDSASEGTK